MPDICITRSTSVLSELFWGLSTYTFSARKPSSHTVRFFSWHDVLACHFTSQFALLPSASLPHRLLDASSVALQGFWGRSLMHLLPASGSSAFLGKSYSSCWLPFISSLPAAWIFFRKLCVVVQPLMPQLKNPFADKLSGCQQLLPEQLLHGAAVAFRHLKARGRSSREDSWLTFSSYSRQTDFWLSVISSVKTRGSKQ